MHIGPAWYLEEQALPIEIDNEIEVTGSRVVFKDTSALIAAEIKIGDPVIVLRELTSQRSRYRDGIPRWRHQGPRAPQGPKLTEAPEVQTPTR